MCNLVSLCCKECGIRSPNSKAFRCCSSVVLVVAALAMTIIGGHALHCPSAFSALNQTKSLVLLSVGTFVLGASLMALFEAIAESYTKVQQESEVAQGQPIKNFPRTISSLIRPPFGYMFTGCIDF